MTGVGALVRLILRRDRVILPLWVFVLALLPIVYVSAMRELVPTEAERIAYADGIQASPAQLALLSPLFGHSIGALVAYRSGVVFVLVGLASVLTVLRHTRAEEEAGRRELIGSTVVKRQAPLAAAVLVTMTANLVLGLVVSLGVAASLPAAGSFALGLGMTCVGVVFTAVGALCAQLTEGARAARGIAIAILGTAYILRAAGDANGPDSPLAWLSWLSPLGWAQHVRAFAGERWLVLVVTVVLAAAVTAAAFVFGGRRDLAGGLLPTPQGPAGASAGLRTPLALAWRLHRGVLLSWAVGAGVYGVVIGAIAGEFAKQFNGNPEIMDIIGRLGGGSGVTDALIATCMGILGIAVSAYAVSAALRMRSEEESQRAEPVLAASVSRARFAASHLAFVVLGPAAILAVGGLAAGLVHGGSTGALGRELPRVLGSALVQLPAVWVLAGVAVALFGLAPRLAMASWAAVAFCLFLGQVGAILQLDQWALDLSPFSHLPRLPAADVALTPLAVLVAVSAVLTLGGVAAFRRRDLT